MIYLLDTNILIDVITDRKGHAAILERFLVERNLLATCAVVVSEMCAGMRAAEEVRTKMLLESLEFLPITFEIAKHSGILRRDFTRKGKTLSLADTTIAAVALAYGCTLVTENEKEFPIPQVQLHVP